MASSHPTLHMLCGRIAAGKSTLAAELVQGQKTVLIPEDDWLGTLFGDEMHTVADYVRCAEKLRRIMARHVVALLNEGVSVVLDFPANTVESRGWMRDVLERTGAAHVLHVLDVPETECLARLQTRNARGEHRFAVTEAQFRQISAHFTLPIPEEGFAIRRHGSPDR
ncbi:ATP-binding protein [uncultured Marivita sp.]|uniref:AAA family ATPase n=1 Tax=uncultured Marivita sp. TaxID=888080 RepID=UPI002607E4A4|nr:ATP-binding protein [uncultured Marivita sp.]